MFIDDNLRIGEQNFISGISFIRMYKNKSMQSNINRKVQSNIKYKS